MLTIVLILVRALLPTIVRHYVNRALDRSLVYGGQIGSIDIALWRGAYSIRDIHLSKRTADVPVPFFAATQVDLSIQWNALVHGRVVGQVVIDGAQLNFVAGSDASASQTGAGGPWLQMIQGLFPFSINSVIVRNGSVHLRAYQSRTPMDVYLNHLNGSIDDLSNLRNQINPLVTRVEASARAMNQASFQLKMTLDPFSYRPTFHLAVRLLGLDVTRLNPLALTYGDFDFKRGWFDLVLEADSKEGQIVGYIKPLFRNLKVFSLTQDLKKDTVLQFFWQALIGGATTVFKNVPRDQFGTLIPFTSDATGTTTADILATIANVLRNAFVRAYLPRLQPGLPTEQQFHFEAPQFPQALSTTDEPR